MLTVVRRQRTGRSKTEEILARVATVFGVKQSRPASQSRSVGISIDSVFITSNIHRRIRRNDRQWNVTGVTPGISAS